MSSGLFISPLKKKCIFFIKQVYNSGIMRKFVN